MTRKRKNWLGWSAILLIMVASVAIAVALAINLGEASEGESGAAFRLDWIEVMCSLLSGAASVILGVVAMVQTEKANKLTEELAEIDRFQYENSVMSQDCPLIKFMKVQGVDAEERELVLRFVDTKNMPVKAIYVSGMCLYPYLRGDREAADEQRGDLMGERREGDLTDGREEEDMMAAKRGSGVEPVVVQLTERAAKAKFFKYRHRRKGILGYYEARVKCDSAALGRYENFLLEFDLGIVNETEVASVYRYKLLAKGVSGGRRVRGSKVRGGGRRDYDRRGNGFGEKKSPERGLTRNDARRCGSVKKMTVKKLRVMHQFYEIETTMGEEKFREGME